MSVVFRMFMSLEDKIPTVNWPKKSGIHKELYGMSKDYQISIDNDQLNKVQALVPEWNIMHKT